MASILDINAAIGPICPENLTKYGWEYDSVNMCFTKSIYNIIIGVYSYEDRRMVKDSIGLPDVAYAVIKPYWEPFLMCKVIYEEDIPIVKKLPDKTYEFYVEGVTLGLNPYHLTHSEQVSDMGEIDMIFNKWRDALLEAGVPEKYFINLK